jgi:cellulose synthase/poly-beta-1,6-N-acetylglucosamine synthase-like glycosyltransferase
MKITFWILIALILYCYLGYPLILKILTKLITRRIKKSDILPGVSVLLSVCDEEDVIEKKLRNLCSLDYPDD